MADNNNMPKYGEKPSAAETIPFEKFDPATGGFKPVSVDQESNKMTYKYSPPSETFAGIPSKAQPYVGIPQTDKPLWSFVRHVPIDNNVSYFLEDRVTPNPDKEFKSILKDRYGRHIMFKGTREQTLEYAQNWDFQHADLEKSDFPKLEFESRGPNPDDPNDVGFPFIPGEREGGGQPMSYFVGSYRDTGPVTNMDISQPYPNIGGAFNFETARDIRGFETFSGKYRSAKNLYFPTLAKRFASDMVEPVYELGKLISVGAPYGVLKGADYLFEVAEWAGEWAVKGVGLVSKKAADKAVEIRQAREKDNYGISKHFDKWAAAYKKNAYDRVPSSFEIFAYTIGQPTEEEVKKGIAAWREQDLRTFFENPNQSQFGRIIQEIGIGWGFMKGINTLLRTVPKGINTYTHYLDKGKTKYIAELEADLLRQRTQGGIQYSIPQTLKEREQAWNNLTDMQKDTYARKSLTDDLLALSQVEGAGFFAKTASRYKKFTTEMRFDIGRKLLTPATDITVRNPVNVFRRDVKSDKYFKVKPFKNYYASEEFHSNVYASVGAVWTGDFFEFLGLNQTAGYLVGAFAFSIGGIQSLNNVAFLRHYRPEDVATLGASKLVRFALTTKNQKYLDDVEISTPDGATRKLTLYEKKQVGHLVDAIGSMPTQRQTQILNNMEGYENLIQKLTAQGGDAEALALQIGQVADLSTVRAIQGELVDKINLGVGVNLNIKQLEKSFAEEKVLFNELSRLAKNVLGNKTISNLGEESDRILGNINEYFNDSLNALQQEFNQLNQANDIFIQLADASTYKDGQVVMAFDELFTRQSAKVQMSILNALNIENIKPNDPEAPRLIREEYTKIIAKMEDDQDRYIMDMISHHKSNPATAKNDALDFVSIYESRRNNLRMASDRLYAPVIAKIDQSENLDITNWVDDFIISGDSLFGRSKAPENKLVNAQLPVDFQHLVPKIIGEEISDTIDSMIAKIADEAGDTSQSIKKAILDNYEIDVSDGLSFYKWVKEGGEEVDDFLKKYGEDFTFDKIEVSGQGIVNIRRRVNGTLSYLRKKINRAGANALDSDKQALNTMIEFKGQFDELFIGAYGDLQLLQELNGVDRTWSRTLAPMIHSEFAYDIGRYGRSLAKGDISDYGSNRLYGLDGAGVDPIEWSDTMLNMIHNDPVKAARYFNFQFGQEITLANGSKAYKIVDPKMQKAVARILNGAIERNAKKFGERYFKELELRTTVGDRKLKAPDSSIIDNLANERIFQEQLMIPKGSSYMNVTSTAQTPRRIYIGEQQFPFDTSSSALYEKNIKELIKSSPEAANIHRAADALWKRTELEVELEIEKFKTDIDNRKIILTDFFRGEGISYKPGAFNIKKAYTHFTDDSTGSVERVKEYRKYFFEAHKDKKIGNTVMTQTQIQKEWDQHIRDIFTRGFLDNQMMDIPDSFSLVKIPGKRGQEQYINQPDKRMKAGASEHLIDYEDVFVEAIGPDHYADLLDIVTFSDIALSGKSNASMKSIGVTNVPSEMELRAIMSRVYGVVRQVVSKHWVATEFFIHSTRGQKGQLLGALLRNPEITKFVRDSLRAPKTITEDRVVRLNSIMPRVFHEAAVVDAVHADDASYYDDIELINESGQPIREGTMVPKNGVYRSVPNMNMGGRVSMDQQMNRLNFR